MSIESKLMAAGSKGRPLRVEDVYSCDRYVTNDDVKKVNTGIDGVNNDVLVWAKLMEVTNWHELYDTKRGAGARLFSNSMIAESRIGSYSGLNFTDSGFTLGPSNNVNQPANEDGVAWTFRKAPKFFDTVLYTGDGTANNIVPHSLDTLPGMIIFKAVDASSDWVVWCRTGSFQYARRYFNKTGDSTFGASGDYYISKDAIRVGSLVAGNHIPGFNDAGTEYVMYLFADQEDEDSVIKCGVYSGNGSSNGPKITLGWKPQYLLIQSLFSHATPLWSIYTPELSSNLGYPTGQMNLWLEASNASACKYNGLIEQKHDGFKIETYTDHINKQHSSYFYLAIRSPE